MIANTAQFPSSLQQFNSPPSEWLSQNPSYSNLAIGACIFHADSTTPQVLLIKFVLLLLPLSHQLQSYLHTARRAATDSYPNKWECPGGGCDPTDSSILSSAAREVLEETGLTVRSFVRQIKAGTNADEDIEFFGKGGEWAGEKWRKVCFLVEVESGEVVLDEKEHQAWKWASREEVERAEMVSEATKQVVRNAFAFWEASQDLPREEGSGEVTAAR